MNKPVNAALKRVRCSLGLLALALFTQQAVAQSIDPRAAQEMAAAGANGLPNIVAPVRPDAARQSNVPVTRPGKSGRDPKGAFEMYAETVTGKSLPIFGRDLFTDVPSTFAPFDSAQVNPDYVIGTGDEIQIRGWGMVDIDVSAVVDRSGAVYIPRVGAIRVAGVAYRDLQGHLKKSIGKFYTNFELTASIAQTRAVQVYVVGNAVRPGTYTLNSMSTLLNALFTSGGPSATGTMRNIQVKRGGATVATFDLYAMLVNGDKSKDISLRDGDVIFIPEVGPLVAMTGNIKQPGIFELKGATSVADVLQWAGGFDSAAESKRVILERNVDNAYQTVMEVVGGSSPDMQRLGGVPARPTDVLRVFAPGAIPVQVQIQHEYVRVSGEVAQSGVFQIKKGETLRELVSRLGGATENGYLYATQLSRESVRVTQQARLNEVADRFERDVEANASVRMAGKVDKDNVATISAEIERQRILAQKLRAIKAEGRIVLEMQNADAELKHLPELALQDGDSVYIPRRPGTVGVLGAVFQPNSFIFRRNRTVGDFIELAGGTTATADESEMYVIRADGTAKGNASGGWFSGLKGKPVYPGDTVVVPEKLERTSWAQTLREWTTIFYQFGLGAAGLKVLQN